MNRRQFVQSAALAPLAVGTLSVPLEAFALPAATGPIALQPHFESTLRRVLSGTEPAYTPDFILEDVRPHPGRRFTQFSGDVSGRYIGALATAALVYGPAFPADARRTLDTLVQQAIALQKPEGFFGAGFHTDQPNDDDLALLWGNGRLLVGLIEYYRLRPSPQVLAACTRLGDFLVSIAPLMLSDRIRNDFGAQHFASSYICWTQQSEGLANLYALTHDARYSQLAESIAAVTERRPSDHAHGYLSSVRGWVDLYNFTGNVATLARAEAAWQDVAQSKDLLITGGVPEGWSPNNHRTEGCGEVDWLRLSLGLWKATGKPQYLAMAERTLFNELAFNQFEGGDFGHHVYTETGLPAAGAIRAWWCCTLHGLRAFPDIQTSVFRAHSAGLDYDLPLSGTSASAYLAVSARSALHMDGTITLTITAAPTAAATLRIRQPEWSDPLALALNGTPAQPEIVDGYASLHRSWKAGDTVTVRYGMPLRRMPAGNSRTAFWKGPWLLGAPAAENSAYFNELTLENKLTGQPQPPAALQTKLKPGFSIPIAATAFQALQAEYPDQPITLQLRALAEQSGQPTTSWELRFLTT